MLRGSFNVVAFGLVIASHMTDSYAIGEMNKQEKKEKSAKKDKDEKKDNYITSTIFHASCD